MYLSIYLISNRIFIIIMSEKPAYHLIHYSLFFDIIL